VQHPLERVEHQHDLASRGHARHRGDEPLADVVAFAARGVQRRVFELLRHGPARQQRPVAAVGGQQLLEGPTGDLLVELRRRLDEEEPRVPAGADRMHLFVEVEPGAGDPVGNAPLRDEPPQLRRLAHPTVGVQLEDRWRLAREQRLQHGLHGFAPGVPGRTVELPGPHRPRREVRGEVGAQCDKLGVEWQAVAGGVEHVENRPAAAEVVLPIAVGVQRPEERRRRGGVVEQPEIQLFQGAGLSVRHVRERCGELSQLRRDGPVGTGGTGRLPPVVEAGVAQARHQPVSVLFAGNRLQLAHRRHQLEARPTLGRQDLRERALVEGRRHGAPPQEGADLRAEEDEQPGACLRRRRRLPAHAGHRPAP
jgi:hypothetical protein